MRALKIRDVLWLIYLFYRHFSENNVKAMDETWYKRAVDQHSIEPESFVFSVPFDSNLNEQFLITATHAVFVEHNGHRAPAAVVGLQYQHSTLASHFLNVTSKVWLCLIYVLTKCEKYTIQKRTMFFCGTKTHIHKTYL